MNPIGQHIKIHQPEPINTYSFLIEKEPVSKAEVLSISPDVSVPFSSQSTIYFYTGKHIKIKEEIFIPLDFIVGWN